MTIHIQRFVDRLRGSEARAAKDFIMPINEAKDLHADITKLLLTLQHLQEQQNNTPTDQVIEVQVSGGNF